MERKKQLLEFLKEIEKFKSIERHIYLDNGRKENDAEHTWHVAMFLLLFQNDLPKDLDFIKMLKMVLIHDLCEIYAGDTFFFDKDKGNKKERESNAAKKLFSKLPGDLQEEFIKLFSEYHACETKEAKFVSSFDKLQPILQNIVTKGKSWKKYNINYEMLSSKKEVYMKHDKFIMEIYNSLLKEIRDKNLLG